MEAGTSLVGEAVVRHLNADNEISLGSDRIPG